MSEEKKDPMERKLPPGTDPTQPDPKKKLEDADANFALSRQRMLKNTANPDEPALFDHGPQMSHLNAELADLIMALPPEHRERAVYTLREAMGKIRKDAGQG
jgi:hypothetical protein